MTANFHTHCRFCDGKDEPEALVKAALAKGFSALGFSCHSYNPPDEDFCMPQGAAQTYRREIARLKEKYRGQIALFCGIEQDIFSPEPTDGYDYVIGSVHSVQKSGRFLSIDNTAAETKRIVDDFYGGDFDGLAEDYFALVAQVAEKTGADIIGHFDLISKFSEPLGFGESPRFLNAAEQAVKQLVPYGKPFEINTGAMARGIRSVPYPSPAILKIIRKHGGEILLASDCHDKAYLDFGFDAALRLAKAAGFSERLIFTAGGFQKIPIN